MSFCMPQVWRLVCILAACATTLPADLTASDSPQWGQAWSRNMVSNERGLPDSFDPASGKNIKWKVPLGSETYATPVIAGGKVLIGTNNRAPRDPRHQGDRSVLLCLNEQNGDLLWQLVVPKLTNSIFWDWPHSGICSPASVEGDQVYIVSNRGEVLCLDIRGMANGNGGSFQDEARHSVPFGTAPIPPSDKDADILWAFDMVKECGIRQHDQAHASILIHGDFLYVNTSNGVDDSHRHIAAPDAPSLIVLDKRTGRLVARDDEHIGPRIFHSTWSSPALGTVNGRDLIFFGGGDGIVYAFQALRQKPEKVAVLEKIWQFDGDPTAPKVDVHKFNSNRKISPSNIKSMPVYQEGRLYVTLGGDVWWGKRACWLQCIDAQGSGDISKTGLVWSYPLQRHCMTTPSVYDGMVFAADSAGQIHCVEATTGRPLWVQETGSEIWASPLVTDGKVYVGTRGGDFWVMAAEKEKRVLGKVDLDSPMHSSPAAAHGVLYVASMRFLYAVCLDK